MPSMEKHVIGFTKDAHARRDVASQSEQMLRGRSNAIMSTVHLG